jgi:hypothetical protein
MLLSEHAMMLLEPKKMQIAPMMTMRICAINAGDGCTRLCLRQLDGFMRAK